MRNSIPTTGEIIFGPSELLLNSSMYMYIFRRKYANAREFTSRVFVVVRRRLTECISVRCYVYIIRTWLCARDCVWCECCAEYVCVCAGFVCERIPAQYTVWRTSSFSAIDG